MSTTSQQSHSGPQNFEAAIEKYLQEGAKTRTEAILKAERNFPELHQEYLERANREYQERRAEGRAR